MNLSKSVDFLLENAGSVIQYRLHKEILHDLTKTQEENLLEKVYQTPYFKLLSTYVKPNGYIGRGAHSWDNWRGEVLHRTYLEDGETAVRLLSYYAVPKKHPYIVNFVEAMRNEEILRQEFSYIPPEVERFNRRNVGLNSGSSLMVMIYTMQALLGYGDDEYIKNFRDISLDAFQNLLSLNSIDEITKLRKSKNPKNNYPYVEADTYLPCSGHLTTLAYTQSWRTSENVRKIATALNHLNAIMREDNSVAVKVGNKYYGPLWALVRPIKPFTADNMSTVMYRRLLTEIAMLGVGETVDIIRESVINVQEAINTDGVLCTKYKKSSFSMYPTAYVDIVLESDHKRKYALECDLTFWALQFLTLTDPSGHPFCLCQK